MRIRQAVIEAMFDHARRDRPNECCGLLIGTSHAIERAEPARNLRSSPTRYLVDPADHCRALREARAAGRRVVGVYHSHPHGPARPSATDLREASYPEYVYLIVSPGIDGGDAQVVGFQPVDDAYTTIELERV